MNTTCTYTVRMMSVKPMCVWKQNKVFLSFISQWCSIFAIIQISYGDLFLRCLTVHSYRIYIITTFDPFKTKAKTSYQRPMLWFYLTD